MDLAQLIESRLKGDDASDALEHDGTWYDWGALRRTAEEVDDALTRAGIGAGARVGLVARNRPGLVAAMLALMATRRRVVMLYAFQAPAALANDLRTAALPAVIADSEDWTGAPLESTRASGSMALSVSGDMTSPARCLAAGAPSPQSPQSQDETDVAVEMLTSGTTGAPKRVPMPWTTLNAAAADLLGINPDHTAGAAAPPDILPFPIGNISGLYFLIPAIGLGRRLVLLERFELDSWLAAVRRHGTAFAAVPPAAVRMLVDTELQAGQLGNLAALGVGAAPLDPKLQADFESRFGLPILVSYGATEFCGVVTTWTPEDHQQHSATKRGSVGRPRPGIRLRIVDGETGAECPPDHIGVIEAQVPRIGPDFVRTTDLGRIDADGFLFLHGRADEVINRGGFKVEPARIAAALCEHPAVADAGVIGIADERLGCVPAAAVELRPQQPAPDQETLLLHLRERLRSFELPVEIRVVDALPRTPSMKVRLADLRSMLERND